MNLAVAHVSALVLAAAALGSRLEAQAAPRAPLAGSSFAITVNRLTILEQTVR